MGAFLLVIVIGALVIYGMTTKATQSAFHLYTTESSQMWAERLAPVYGEYYNRVSSWQGVEAYIDADQQEPVMGGMMNGAGRGRGPGMSSGWMGGIGQRLILVDAQGLVVADTENELTQSELPIEELVNGSAIVVNGQQVGTLIVAPADIQAVTNPASTFITSVNRSILISVLIAGGISLVLVLLFSVQITAPVRKMQKAAGAIANGDLSQRVPVGANDELGDLAQTFNHMAGSLAAAETQRRQMLADIAHELRNPMAVIQANAEAMQDGVLPLDLAQVNTIHAETLLLGRLIDDLRLISLAEAGELRLEREETDLAHLLNLIAERIRAQCQQKKITLNVIAPENLPHVYGDAGRITQVLNNLVANALRYTPGGGSITVQAEPRANSVTVSVTDTGSGIVPEDLPWIFDRFYRADKSRTRASGGSGLGLAIVKQLVAAQGGQVSAFSPVYADAGQGSFGTRIAFTLPVHLSGTAHPSPR